jgi:hypothetical protein
VAAALSRFEGALKLENEWKMKRRREMGGKVAHLFANVQADNVPCTGIDRDDCGGRGRLAGELADLDKAIEKNVEAVLIKNRLKIRSQEWCADLNRRRVFAIAPGRGRKTFDGSAQRETGGERARG